MRNPGQARSRAGMLFGFLAVVVVVSSVIGTLAATGRFASRSGAAGFGILDSTVKIDTARTAHLYCPSAPSFSPNGSELAVLGTAVPCSDPSALLLGKNQHKVAIFDAHTGVLKQIQPLDSFFQQGVVTNCTGIPIQAIQFAGLGWSPDGQHFGVLYAAFSSTSDFSPDNQACSGLLLLSFGTHAVGVIEGDAGFFDASIGTYSGYPVWDLNHLTVSPPQSIAPALVYGWNKFGVPQTISALTSQVISQLPIRAGPGYPVGNPQSGSTYTIWQPGIVVGSHIASDGLGSPTSNDLFLAQFPSWMPNSSYVTMMVAGVLLPAQDKPVASVASPASATTVPQLPFPQALTQVPARDAALLAVQHQVSANSWAMVAWNTMGTVLASIDCSNPAQARLQLRETNDGTLVGSVPLAFGKNDAGCSVFNASETLEDYLNPNLVMQWSPDGSHLALSDQSANTIILWQVATGSAA